MKRQVYTGILTDVSHSSTVAAELLSIKRNRPQKRLTACLYTALRAVALDGVIALMPSWHPQIQLQTEAVQTIREGPTDCT